MSEHTPGPWRVELPDFDEAWSEHCENGESGEHCLADINSDGKGWQKFAHVHVIVEGEQDDEGMANARLIAAAPDLLAVVRPLLEIVTDAIMHGMPVTQKVADARNAAVQLLHQLDETRR